MGSDHEHERKPDMNESANLPFDSEESYRH